MTITIHYTFECGRCVFVVECPKCRGVNVIATDNMVGGIRYVHGDAIQSCLPELDPDTRETLLTGYCPECFRALFRNNKKGH